ncbi:MAG TPA: hypothetical protein QF564_27850 [Pirellulaceae bacterium]|nr:hypothetical protein [Pirellulaceae bacterium]
MKDSDLFPHSITPNIPSVQRTLFRWMTANTVAKDQGVVNDLVAYVRFHCKEWDFVVTGFDREQDRVIGFIYWRHHHARSMFAFSVQSFHTWCRDNGFQARLDEDWKPTQLARCGEVFWR